MKRIWLLRESGFAIEEPDNDVAKFDKPPQKPTISLPEKNVVFWFRRGLRFHDNPALLDSLRQATSLRCIYFIDPWFTITKTAINKWRFLLECLSDLDNTLQKFGSRLYVVRGQPTSMFPTLFKEWNTHLLAFEQDPEPFGAKRDRAIRRIAADFNVEVLERCSHTLFDLRKLVESQALQPLTYKGFQDYLKANEKLPDRPVETLSAAAHLQGVLLPVSNDHDTKYGVPTLTQLGFDSSEGNPGGWKGGETEARTRIVRHLERKAFVASFEKPKITPRALLSSSANLSPYLRFGCLSARSFFWKLYELYVRFTLANKPKCECQNSSNAEQNKNSEQMTRNSDQPYTKNTSAESCKKCTANNLEASDIKPSIGLQGQLLWREFYYAVACNNPNFDKIEGNPVCVQIAWDKNTKALAKWAEGFTGFPWIDAIMRQLRTEGWVHHVARHSVACFLTRGDLWISWEEGMKVFDELSLDADWSCNAGFWQWLSCSSFFQQFFHPYCPVGVGKRIDPGGEYVRKYVPALRDLPTRYVYEPWMAPAHIQEAAGCVVGRDYPMPMINHREAARINWARLTTVYSNLHIKSQAIMRKLIGTTDKAKLGEIAQAVAVRATKARTCACLADEAHRRNSDEQEGHSSRCDLSIQTNCHESRDMNGANDRARIDYKTDMNSPTESIEKLD